MKPQRRLLRPRNILAILLLSTFIYGGAVWYSFKSDNFHDFFTEYIPGSTQCIHAIEDYQFKQRYPGATTIRKGDRISDLGRKGPHISAIDANRLEVAKEKRENEKREKEEAKKDVQKKPPVKGGSSGLATQVDRRAPSVPMGDLSSSAAAVDAKSISSTQELETSSSKPSVPKETSTSEGLTPKESTITQQPAKDGTTPAEAKPVRLTIELLDISPNDAALEKMANALNDLIKSFNSTSTYDSASAPLYEFLKSSVAELNTQLPEIISSTRSEAESQIQAQAKYFSQLHEDLKAAFLQERNLMANEWMAAFDRERDELQNRYNERLAEELQKQGEVHDQRLQNELLEQSIVLRRRMQREIQAQVETERASRLGKLASLEKALGELTGLHQDSYNIFSREEKAKKIAIAVQALKDVALVRGGEFTAELAALKSVSNNDELVKTVIASIDPEACSKGIMSQAELASRFQSLSNELRKVALLPPDAGVVGHAASWLLSKVMFRQRGYVRGGDVDSTLARVEMLLEGGQLEDATREVNSINGWGHELARDWLREARKRLELIQAIDVRRSLDPI